MKIPPVGDELSVRTDGWTEEQTDISKLIVAFRSFANAPKKAGHGHRQYSELKNVRT
jgi:hypothetical protein